MADFDFNNGNPFAGPGTMFTGSNAGPAPTFNVAESMGVQGGMAPLLNFAVQGLIPSMFGAKGHQFAQFMPQMNLYEQMRRRSAFEMQQEVVRGASALDRGTYEQMLKGFSNITGTAFGVREQEAAQTMAKDLSSIMPMLAQVAPDMVDRLHGSRGSAVVMAQRMTRGAQMMMDPSTGQMGLSKESMKSLTENVFENMFGKNADISEMRGVTAGQAGGMFDEMTRRGLVGTGPRTLSEIAKEQLSGQMGPQAPDALQKTMDDLMKLPDFDQKMQQFESNRVVDKLKAMSGAVAAMKDVFGENGRPDAPMNEIFNALQQVTQNRMNSMNPEEIEKLVRNVSVTGRMSGMGLQGMMTNIAAAGQVTDRMGLDRTFAPKVATNAALFSSAFASTFGNVRGFNFINKEEANMLDMQLSASALSSAEANNQAALLRMADTGVIPNNAQSKPLMDYIEKVRKGERVTMMTGPEIQKSLQEAGVDSGNFFAMQRQSNANQAYIDRYKNIGEMARGQGQQRQASRTIQSVFGNELVASIAKSTGGKVENESAITSALATGLLNMTPDELNKYAKNDANSMDFLIPKIREAYEKSNPGKSISNEQIKLGLTVGRGSFAEVVKNIYGGKVSDSSLLATQNTTVLQRREELQKVSEAEASVQSAMAKLGRASPMQRAADALINTRSDTDFGTFMRELFGGISDEKIALAQQEGLGASFEEMRKLNKRDIRKDSAILTKFATDPKLLTIDEADQIGDIQQTYGMSSDDLKEAVEGKSFEEADASVNSRLMISSNNTKRKLIESFKDKDLAKKLDLSGSSVGINAINAVRNAAKLGNQAAGQNAVSLAQQIMSDEGAMSTMTSSTAARILGQLEDTGRLTQNMNPDAATKENTLKAKVSLLTSNDTVRQDIQESLKNKAEADADIKAMVENHKLKKDGISSVEDLRANISAADVLDEDELKGVNALASEREALNKDILNTPDAAEKNKKREKLNEIDRKIRADAQDKGYSAASVLDRGTFKSKLTKDEAVAARDALKRREEASTSLIDQTKRAEKIANDLGINIADVLGGKELTADTQKALLSSMEEVAAEYGKINQQGNPVLQEKEKEKLRKEIAKRAEVMSAPGEALSNLMTQIEGTANAPATPSDEMNKASAEARNFMSRNIVALDKLTAMPEGEGNDPAKRKAMLEKVQSIVQNPEGSKDALKELEKTNPEAGRLIKQLDAGFIKDLREGSVSVEDIEKRLKAQKENKEAAVVRLAPNTRLSGNLDIFSGDVDFKIEEGSKA